VRKAVFILIVLAATILLAADRPTCCDFGPGDKDSTTEPIPAP